MKIQLLGTAAATAMPLPFCNCRVCQEARAAGGKNLRKRSAAIINDELLIDLSPDLCTMAAMYQIDLGKVQYLLQTHSHADHFDAGHFVTRCKAYAAQDVAHLDIVCSPGTCQDMNHWVREQEPEMDLLEDRWQQDLNFRLHEVHAGESIRLGNYTITALDSAHDKRVEALIYIIEQNGKSVLYGTDLKELIPETWEILKRHPLDLVVLDHTYGKGCNSGGHLDGGQVAEIVNQMKAFGIMTENTPVYATHISHEGNDVHERMEERAAQQGYHIGYDGLEIVL